MAGDTYTHGHHESVLRSHRWRTAENSAAYLLPYLAHGMTLLDVGCGPGTITMDLARLIAPGVATGCDSAPTVLAEARLAAEDAGVGAVFELADVSALPYADGNFDVVHAHQVLQHLADPVGALREMRRVCRPGGIIAVRDADYSAMTWYPASSVLDAWMALYQEVARTNSGEPDAGRRLLAWAHAAGFSQVTPGASTWCYATDEARKWWGGLWAQRIVDSAVARQAVAAGLATEQRLTEMAAGWRSWAGEDDGWFAIVHGEILCRA